MNTPVCPHVVSYNGAAWFPRTVAVVFTVMLGTVTVLLAADPSTGSDLYRLMMGGCWTVAVCALLWTFDQETVTLSADGTGRVTLVRRTGLRTREVRALGTVDVASCGIETREDGEGSPLHSVTMRFVSGPDAVVWKGHDLVEAGRRLEAVRSALGLADGSGSG